MKIKPRLHNIRSAIAGVNEKERLKRAKLRKIDSDKAAEEIMRLIGEMA